MFLSCLVNLIPVVGCFLILPLGVSKLMEYQNELEDIEFKELSHKNFIVTIFTQADILYNVPSSELNNIDMGDNNAEQCL